MKTFIVLVYLKYKMHLTIYHFYPNKNYLFSKPIKGLQGYRVGYGFSFNGQEKDDDVSGVGNTMGAEFWEYDTRLARRWNVDPIVKPFLGSYIAFRNNPNWYIDPRGDDDIFSSSGKFLGSTTSGSQVRVVNDKITFEEATKDIPNCTKLITDFRYCPEDLSNRAMLSSIVSFYAIDADIEVKTKTNKKDKHGNFAYVPKDDSYAVLIEENGTISTIVSNKFNIINALVHEKKHRDDNSTWKPLGHIDAIIVQSEHLSFKNTTKDFKQGVAMYAQKLLNEAIELGASEEEINKKVSEFNNSKWGEYANLYFDQSRKNVSLVSFLASFTVKGKKKDEK